MQWEHWPFSSLRTEDRNPHFLLRLVYGQECLIWLPCEAACVSILYAILQVWIIKACCRSNAIVSLSALKYDVLFIIMYGIRAGVTIYPSLFVSG